MNVWQNSGLNGGLACGLSPVNERGTSTTHT